MFRPEPSEKKRQSPASPDADVLGGGEPLLARVRAEASVPGTRAVRFALGYLFVPGLSPIWDAVEGGPAEEVQVLIGNTATLPTEEQRLAVEAITGPLPLPSGVPDVAAAARRDRERTLRDTAGALRENLRQVERTDENARVLVGLARAITQNRLRVRIYGDGRLHAKAYLFARDASAPSVALVGSTNLTLPSPGNPTELNVAVRDPGFASISAWFDDLWDASQDFSRELVAEFSVAWPLFR